jgi:hypothetical protein
VPLPVSLQCGTHCYCQTVELLCDVARTVYRIGSLLYNSTLRERILQCIHTSQSVVEGSEADRRTDLNFMGRCGTELYTAPRLGFFCSIC